MNLLEDKPRSLGEQDNDNSPALPESVRILGVRVHKLTMDATMRSIREFVRDGSPHLVVTSDASGIMAANDNPQFMDVVNNAASLVTPDGAGIIKAAKWLGNPLIERVSGVDIAQNLCALAAQDGFGVFFFGARPGVAQQAADKLKERFPGLNIAGVRDGFFSDQDVDGIVEEINASGAKALLVALGIPKQEIWIRDNMHRLNIGVAMGVGGTFDVLSGNIKRAPKWMQNHGLEWLYRLIKDPSKISKVSVLPKFFIRVQLARLRGERG